jgi:hypothetical protein
MRAGPRLTLRRHFADRKRDFGRSVLELRMRGDLIDALRKRKATDAYSHLEDLAKESPPDDI